MAEDSFFYDLVLSDDRSSITNVIAYQERPGHGLRGVIWTTDRREWIYAPAIIADILYDDSDTVQTSAADRTTAEEAATVALQTELPPETKLLSLCEEGERMGWRYGPPSA